MNSANEHFPVAAARVWLEFDPTVSVHTDENGRFLLEGVPAGKHRLVAYFKDQFGQLYKTRTLNEIEMKLTARKTVDLNLAPATTKVKGRLLDVDGKAIKSGTKLMVGGEIFFTENNGDFETPLLPQSYKNLPLWVFVKSKHDPIPVPLTIADNELYSKIETQLPVSNETFSKPANWELPMVYLYPELHGKFTTFIRSDEKLTITAKTSSGGILSSLNLKWSSSMGTLEETSSSYSKFFSSVNGGVAEINVLITDKSGATGSIILPIKVEGVFSSEKKLLSFSFPGSGIIGVIDEANNSIAVTVPYGTDVTGLVANFTASEYATVKADGINQQSGVTANDFTSPVVYTVTAQNGESQQYVVTVSVAPNSENSLTSFAFASPSVIGVIDEANNSIAVTVPYGTDVTGLVANFTASEYATVKADGINQQSGVTANDFTVPVIYKVIAQNGESQQYAVTVTVAPNSANSLTSFAFASPSVTGTINEAGNSIAVTVPFGTDVSPLVANFTASANATVKVGSTVQTSGVTANNFANPVVYTVVAENGDVKNYLVSVITELSSENQLTAFLFTSPAVAGTIDQNANTVYIKVPFATDVSNLIAHFSSSPNSTVKIGSDLQTSGVTANDFSSVLTYSVYAQNGDKRDYLVTVEVEVKVFVHYDGNGHTAGTVPVENNQYNEGDLVTVAENTGNLTRDNYYFVDWNTRNDGLGVSYPTGSTFNIGTTDVILFANWSLRYVFNSKFGEAGSGDGQLNHAYDCDCDSADNIYIADSSNHRIQVFDNNGTFLRKWGSYGSADTQFNFPVGITVDSDDNVFVSDNHNRKVKKFDSNGNFIMAWGGQGSGDGEFSSNAGIACDSAGNIFVADVGLHRIQKFDNNGDFICAFGAQGSAPGQMDNPYGCEIDSDNIIDWI